MKKSEIYDLAMRIIVDSGISAKGKVDIIEQLLSDRATALYWEEQEAKKEDKE